MQWLKAAQCEGVHMDTEPGVWLRSFQLLDAKPKPEVRFERFRLPPPCWEMSPNHQNQTV